MMTSAAAQDDFEAATENVELIELLRERIEAHGPITFRDYMELALYHPEHGYYAARRSMGRDADYLTSPEVSPIFGALAGKQAAQFWELMGRPDVFDLVEQGAGTGRLAHDLLRWASRRAPEFANAVRYRIVEISASLRQEQQRRLSTAGNVEWPDELPAAIDGCLLSNELLDAFPVHRCVVRDGKLLEIYVTYRDGGLVEVVDQPSTERIEQYFAELGFAPGDGCVFEVNLGAVEWMERVAQAVRRGFVLTFDYGYEARELYAPWRRDGTLLCFYRHNPSSDPYARVGRQDMTAHIDFTTLKRVGKEHGLEVAGFTTQGRFLSELGIGGALEPATGESPGALEEYYARRRAVQELIDPAGLGRIRALAQRKDIDASVLAGFGEERDA